METILAITLDDSRVTCLRLEAHARTAVATDYFHASYGSNEELITILAPVLEKLGRCDSCRVSLGSANFYFRNISLPFSDTKKIEKVLVHELEDATSYSCADMQYDFLSSPCSGGGTEITVALIEKHRDSELISLLAECGVDPDVITITELNTINGLITKEGGEQAFLLVNVEGKRLSLSLVYGGRLRLIRSIVLPEESEGPGIASKQEVINAIRQTLLSVKGSSAREELPNILVKGEPSFLRTLQQSIAEQFGTSCLVYEPVERQFLKIEPKDNHRWDAAIMDDSLCLAMRRKGDGLILNFRKGVFKKQKSVKDLKKIFLTAGVMALLLIVGFGAYGAYDLSRLKTRQNDLKSEIETVFKETLPEVTRVVRPVEQLRVKVDEVKKLYSVSRHGSDTMGMVRLIAEISSRIPPDLPINLTRFVADGDSVRLRGETNDFKTVDSVQKSLEESPSFKTVIISSANLATTGEGVRFEIKLELTE